ncbi:natural resistance-associated macrophage protein [Athelia psychrophila]|uniref:Natural resistance-associated macrophage protein n=1 Tax=Athelia psychrophila TaxID=1759441 RepID=A0A166SBK6_9AGAM|nr:natural resistance-associated macrophage protein [Fibularhizoctonia sp. CBS 109695]
MSTTSYRPWSKRLKDASSVVVKHATKHTGVGIVCAVAYFDPGNWGVDLQAGSVYGYKLLFVVLLAGLFAVFLQLTMSCTLDLASHCRILLHSRPKHKLLYRYLLHYPLYIIAEIAIISTDLAELLGSAIALCLIWPALPLWAGVLLTAGDVIFILALGDPLGGRPAKMFEWLIAVLVLVVLICMSIIIAEVDVNWAQAFDGFVPSKTIFASGGIYTSVGILGATVMPHSLFLGSALATQDRLAASPSKTPSPDGFLSTAPSRVPLPRRLATFFRSIFKVTFTGQSFKDDYEPEPKTHVERENNALGFVRAHLWHGIVDMALSLLGFAVIINALILVLAAAVFYYGAGADATKTGPASLFDAHTLIRDLVGKPAALLFALALLAAGQSASMIATVAGQSVSEGFLRWRVSPAMRRLVTRLIGLVPSLIIAAAGGRSGLNGLLVASQVILSVSLPFVTLPLIYLTSSKAIMSVRVPVPPAPARPLSTSAPPLPPTDLETEVASHNLNNPSNAETAGLEGQAEERVVDYSNGWVATGLGVVIWLVMVAANGYVLVTLALGEDL